MSQITDEKDEKVDVAVNIFAKPYQTALALLSLVEHSGAHINSLWLQFEPVASKYDKLSPYLIGEYLGTELEWSVNGSQPDYWLDLNPPDLTRLSDKAYRMGIRYQGAFEHSQSRLLFIMHNDVFILKDLLGPMLEEMGDAIAIGQLGQCWNCPAANAEVMRQAFGASPCSPATYEAFRPTREQLVKLYANARKLGVFARPYDTDGFRGEFEKQPWPLPECRVNEWACLLDLERSRPLCIPFGPGLPPGAFGTLAAHNLDTGVPWFRQMHAAGFHARHFDIHSYVEHWVGTGNNTPSHYTFSEERALGLLRKNYPDYLKWVIKRQAQTSNRK